jgi:hypothetical protein
MQTNFLYSACAAAVISLIAGCSKEPPSDVKPTRAAAEPAFVGPLTEPTHELTPEFRQMMDLMRVVYVGHGRYFNDYVLAELPDPDDRKTESLYRITPVAMRELDDGMVAIVANAEQTDESGHSFSAHVTPGLLNVYLLQKSGDTWKLVRYLENFDQLGSFGHIGEVKWIKLSDTKPGFAVLHGGTWQGYSIQTLALYDLADVSMHNLLKESIPVMSTSEGACVEETNECWTVDGNWRFEQNMIERYDDLVIDFSGFKEARPEGTQSSMPRTRTTLKANARYEYKDGAYSLVTGENIVPGI